MASGPSGFYLLEFHLLHTGKDLNKRKILALSQKSIKTREEKFLAEKVKIMLLPTAGSSVADSFVNGANGNRSG